MLDKITKVDMAIDLVVNEDKLVKRLTMRRICKDCNSVFHLEFNPPKAAGKWTNRRGAIPAFGRHREDGAGAPASFKESTLPLTEYYAKKGILKRSRGKGTSARSIDES